MCARTTPVASAHSALTFAGLTGSSIAGHDAAPWVTDFLNAAYYRRPAADREVDDVRLAFCVLTTYWWRKDGHRRLHLSNLRAFHRAFGADRFATAESTRGTLNRAQLLAGGDRLLGDWFSGAYADEARRGWGIAFPTVEERDAYDPGCRLELARLGALTPEGGERPWHVYPPVALPSADAAIALLSRPERWPDFASEIGRFTPLRRGGLLGQTFEIEVAAGTDTGRPIFTRGYVTITALGTGDEGVEPGLPDGATPRLSFDLTTHQGHFMGAGHSHLLIYEQDGQAYVCDAGTWDPMSWHLTQAYRHGGQVAQEAFWGDADPAKSMLRQLAARA